MQLVAHLLLAAGCAELLRLRVAEVVLTPASSAMLMLFSVQSERVVRVEVQCAPRLPARVFHRSQPEGSLCGQGFAGSAREVNAWARGIGLAGTGAVGEEAVRFRVSEKGGERAQTLALRVTSVSAVAVQMVQSAVELQVQGDSVVVARVDAQRLPPGPQLSVETEGEWPAGVSAVLVGGEVQLRLERWQSAGLDLPLRFRVHDRRNGLVSASLALRLRVPAPMLSPLSWLGALTCLGAFLLFSLLYLLLAALRLSRAETAPPAAAAISAWNSRVLSEVKRGQASFCSTAASASEQRFRDVTLDRISPLELSQTTIGSEELGYLSAIIGENQPRAEPL